MHQDGFLHEYADLFSALVCHAFRLEQELVEAAYRGHSFRRAAEGFGQYDEREAQRVEEGEDDECELGAEAVDAGDVRSEDDLAGERGINLSGGQRQRVCLARAVYHDCDIVLLDNPLSAVDQHTSTHIFNKCIKGVLKEKAVILIAHQLELLPQCDRVAIMDDGKVSFCYLTAACPALPWICPLTCPT
jgi:ABC-type glutathione transport system ATPase component